MRLIPEPPGKIVQEILFEGVNLLELSMKRMRAVRGKRISMIFQEPMTSLNPRMTVNQIIADPMTIHGVYQGREREERIAFLLEKVGFTSEQGRRYPHEFSGGQRQRIGIARALALNPQLINLLVDLQEEFQLSPSLPLSSGPV